MDACCPMCQIACTSLATAPPKAPETKLLTCCTIATETTVALLDPLNKYGLLFRPLPSLSPLPPAPPMASPRKAAATATLQLCALYWLCVSCVEPAAAQYGAAAVGVTPPAACSDCSLCKTHCQPAPLPSPPPPPPVLPSYGTPPPPAEGNSPPTAVTQCSPYPPPSPYAYLPYYNYSASSTSRLPAPLLSFLAAAPLAWTVVVGLAPPPRALG